MPSVQILVGLAVACALWGTVTAIRIGRELEKRGEKVNWFLMRLAMIGWISRYKRVTIEEQGQPGPLYRQFLLAMNAALALAVVALLVRSAR
jgi:hypothetical protein